jgi:XapX domain-containing protein
MKVVLRILLGFIIGAGCRAFLIPAPAPPAVVGALLVLAMTMGYLVADRYLARRAATTRHLCGGPTGETRANGR